MKALYRMWAETNRCIFCAENEEVAVADHFIASYTTVYQQVAGKSPKECRTLSHLPYAVSGRLLKKALSTKGLHWADHCAIASWSYMLSRRRISKPICETVDS